MLQKRIAQYDTQRNRRKLNKRETDKKSKTNDKECHVMTHKNKQSLHRPQIPAKYAFGSMVLFVNHF